MVVIIGIIFPRVRRNTLHVWCPRDEINLVDSSRFSPDHNIVRAWSWHPRHRRFSQCGRAQQNTRDRLPGNVLA